MPAPEPITVAEVLDRFDHFEQRASSERAAQTTATTSAIERQTDRFAEVMQNTSSSNERALSELGGRMLRVGLGLGTLGLLGILALAGVQVWYGGVTPAPLTIGASGGPPMGSGGAEAQPDGFMVIPTAEAAPDASGGVP